MKLTSQEKSMSTANLKATLWRLVNFPVHPLRPAQRLAEWLVNGVMRWMSSFETSGPVSSALLDDMDRKSRSHDFLRPFNIDQRDDII